MCHFILYCVQKVLDPLGSYRQKNSVIIEGSPSFSAVSCEHSVDNTTKSIAITSTFVLKKVERNIPVKAGLCWISTCEKSLTFHLCGSAKMTYKTTSKFVLENTAIVLLTSSKLPVTEPGVPTPNRGGGTYNLAKFSCKLHENEEKIRPWGGGTRPKFVYVDRPLITVI